MRFIMNGISNKIASVQRALAGLDVTAEVPLAALTSFRIGGPAALVARPRSEAELCAALRAAEAAALPDRILGNGTNVLAPDEGFAGLIVRLDAPFSPLRIVGQRVLCSAGDSLSSVSRRSVAAGLSGMEGLEGIPGTVGGACAMNAGAFGAEIRQILRRVRLLRGGELSDVTVQDGDLGHRRSVFAAPNAVVTGAEFELLPDDGHAAERTADFARRRKEKQPLSLPSAGSVFKRPAGHFAGGLIEQCGLKGLRIGGAEVSTLHAGFIVNRGGATCADVVALIEEIQRRVLLETGVRLERELKFWNEV